MSPLFLGEPVENGCLGLHPDELGVSSVDLVLDEERNVLRVISVNMRRDTVPRNVSWLSGLEEAIAVDQNMYDATYDQVGDTGGDWSHPLQRVAFWTSTHAHVKPILPDPSRDKILFRDLGITDSVHPLQEPSALYETAKYYTTNGYCFCKTPEDCKVSDDPTHQCSVVDSVSAILDNEWRDSVVMGHRDDTSSFDWPFAPGILRDGSETLHEPPTQPVGVLHRLPSFQMRFNGANPISNGPAGFDSTSPGGNCHMGRGASTRVDTSVDKCKLIGRNTSWTTLRCENDEIVYLPLEKSKAPDWYIDRMKKERRRCSECKIPDFEDAHFSESEVSFGQPYKLSPVRRVLRAVKQAFLAVNGSTFENMEPRSKQDRVEFMQEHMRQTGKDLGSDGRDIGRGKAALEAAFDKDWLFCYANKSLPCRGNISYAEWEGSPNRLGLCSERLQELEPGDDKGFFVNMELCNIDRQLDSMCGDLQESLYQLGEANCIMAGDCDPSGFFYAPAVFSVSNNDFVRKTVESFYEMHNSSVCPVDQDTVELRAQNTKLTGACASSHIRKVEIMVELLRGVAHTIARMYMYAANLVMNILRLLIDFINFDAVLRDISYWFSKLMDIMMELLVEIGKLVFRLLFEMSTWGVTMQKIIKFLCDAVGVMLVVVKALYCNITRPLITLLIDIIKGVISGFETVINGLCLGTCNFELSAVHDMLDTIKGFLVDKTSSFCENELGDLCDFGKDKPDENDDGTNYVATRCWADFVPQAGASTQLSCTRSDTCRVEPFRDDLVVCDACPPQEVGVFNQYGCDLLTKQCQCRTQHRAITYCTRHDQCSLDATCLMVDKPFASSSWGVDICENCRTTAMCLFDGKERLGRCSCPFKEPVIEPCALTAVGTMPFWKKRADCLYTFADVQGGDDSMYMTFYSLALVPCAIVKPTKMMCVMVSDEGVSFPRLVGYELQMSLSGMMRDSSSFGSRRLFSDGTDFINNGTDFMSSRHELVSSMLLEHEDWNMTADPCRSLVGAYRRHQSMAISDTVALESCVFWRTVGRLTPHIPETMLLSLDDFIAACVHNATEMLFVPTVMQDLVVNILEGWPQALQLVELLIPFMARNVTWLQALQAGTSWVQLNKGITLEYVDHLGLIQSHTTMSSRRRLLQTTDMYYAVSSSSAVMDEVGADDAFKQGAHFGPKSEDDHSQLPFNYWIDADGDGKLDASTCPIAAIWLDEWRENFEILGRYYTEGFYRLPKRDRTLSKTLPFIREVSGYQEAPPIGAKQTLEEVVPFYGPFKNLLKSAGVTPARIYYFLSCTDDTEDLTLCNAVIDFVTCDMESIQLCSRHKRDLLLSIIFILFIFYVVDILMSQVGFMAFRLYLWLNFPFFVMWWAYGYSPACLPMIPTCLLEDILVYVFTLFPQSMHVPRGLQNSPNCWNNTKIDPSQCFKSCIRSPEFNYGSFSSTAAWLSCEMYGPKCIELSLPVNIPYIIDSVQFKEALTYKALAMQRMEMDGYFDDVTAQRMCLFVGGIVSLPYILFFIALAFMVVALAVAPFQMLFAFFQLVLDLLFFTHVQAGSNL